MSTKIGRLRETFEIFGAQSPLKSADDSVNRIRMVKSLSSGVAVLNSVFLSPQLGIARGQNGIPSNINAPFLPE